jgi:hypothetical protein
MTFRAKLGIGVATVACLLILALPSVVSFYDARTRTRLLAVTAGELPVGASMDEMTAFLQRHTTRYAVDVVYHHEYVGVAPRTRVDSMLFDRQVQFVLKLSDARTFANAEIRIYYTFL